MENNLSNFTFSKYFNYLTYVGAWEYKTNVRWIEIAFYIYRIFCFFVFANAIIFQLLDLWTAIGSLEKMTYNMSTSVIVLYTILRLIALLRKKKTVDKLRVNLWKDFNKSNDEEDEAIKKMAVERMDFAAKMFHIAAIIFYPVWIGFAYFSYLWGPRELPFPIFYPINYEESIAYDVGFVLEIICGAIILCVSIEINLLVFGILLQISAQYKILQKNISKLSDGFKYDNENYDRRYELIKKNNYCFNKHLKKLKTEASLKKIISRHLTLYQYVKKFESTFNGSFFIQVLGGSTLITLNGLLLMKMTYTINQKIAQQAVYLVLLVVTMFYNCLFATVLITEYNNVANAAYSASWYEMDTSLQKYFIMIILHAQKQPRITAGKLILMDLDTFLSLLKNIYSWLMFFWQLEAK